MNIMRNFEMDISLVQKECEKRVVLYPEPLRHQALLFMEKNKMLEGQNERSGICYLLPFWLKDTFGVDSDLVRKISLGNAFGILYFLAQDEVMDAVKGEYKGNLLPMANLFYLDLVSLYRSLLPSCTEFWSLFDRFMTEWAYSVAWERKEHWGKVNEYTEEQFILISRKAAPLKICCAALGYLSGRDDLLDRLFAAIDYNQIVFQLVDDWRDWRDDMVKGNYTYFLTLIIKSCGLDDLTQFSEAHVRNAVFVDCVLDKIFKYARKYTKMALDCLSGINVPFLDTYIRQQMEYFNKLKRYTDDERCKMVRGGINSLF